MRRRHNFLNVHPAKRLTESISVTTISISDQKSRRVIPWERFQHLLRCPFRSRMSRNIKMDDFSAMMLQHNEHEQEPKAQSWHYDEINRDELLGMIFQECPPCLRRMFAVSRHVLGNRGFRQFDPELQQLPVNSGRTPGWILLTGV